MKTGSLFFSKSDVKKKSMRSSDCFPIMKGPQTEHKTGQKPSHVMIAVKESILGEQRKIIFKFGCLV